VITDGARTKEKLPRDLTVGGAGGRGGCAGAIRRTADGYAPAAAADRPGRGVVRLSRNAVPILTGGRSARGIVPRPLGPTVDSPARPTAGTGRTPDRFDLRGRRGRPPRFDQPVK